MIECIFGLTETSQMTGWTEWYLGDLFCSCSSPCAFACLDKPVQLGCQRRRSHPATIHPYEMAKPGAQFYVTFEHDYLNKEEFDRDVQFQASGEGSSYPISHAYLLSRIRWHHYYLKCKEMESSDTEDTSSKTLKRSLSAVGATASSSATSIVLKRKCESQIPLERKRRRTDRSWSYTSSGNTDDSAESHI
jgi:hypothetical protein